MHSSPRSAGTDVADHILVDLAQKDDDGPMLPMEAYDFADNLMRIKMPGDQVRQRSIIPRGGDPTVVLPTA